MLSCPGILSVALDVSKFLHNYKNEFESRVILPYTPVLHNVVRMILGCFHIISNGTLFTALV